MPDIRIPYRPTGPFRPPPPTDGSEEASGRGCERCGQWLTVRDKRRLTTPIECAFPPGGTKRSRRSSSGGGESRCPDSDPCRSNMIRTLGGWGDTCPKSYIRVFRREQANSADSVSSRRKRTSPARSRRRHRNENGRQEGIPAENRPDFGSFRACGRVGESERKRASAMADALFPYQNATGGRILRSIP